MYRKFFGLSRLPFKTTPDVSVFYKQGSRQEILQALVYTVSRGDGIIKVTGEVGCGKTMLLRLLAGSLSKRFSIIYINSPNLSSKDMVLYICSELSLTVSTEMQKFTLINVLKKELLRLHSLGKSVVMLVDEAQSIPFDSLEELRLLSNIETADDKLLQIVLFGQTELDTSLENPQIRQLKNRISYSIYVPPLSIEEVNSYLNYRMRKASYDGLDIFNYKISKKIYKLSGGLPRTINIIGDKLLMSAYGTGENLITNRHIKMLPILEGQKRQSLFMRWKFTTGSLLFLSFLLLGLYVLGGNSGKWGVLLPTEVDLKNSALNSPSKRSNIPPATSEIDEPGFILQFADSTSKEDDPVDQVEDAATSLVKKSGQKVILEQGMSYAVNDIIFPAVLSIKEQHILGSRWLKSIANNQYAIQLSVNDINSLEQTLDFYKQYKIPTESLHILIDFNPKFDVFRIKVLHLSSNSYYYLLNAIDRLPSAVKRSKPFVTSVAKLQTNLELTDQKIKEYEVF